MASAAIHYFSGTGNTHRAAKIIEGILKDGGYEASLFRVSGTAAAPTKRYDLSVFAFPVYALDIPHIMERYMARMPEGRGSKAAVITVFGNMSPDLPEGDAGCCLVHGSGLLRKRGYEVVYADTVGYSVNWTALLNTPTAGDNVRNREQGDRKTAEIGRNLLAGVRQVPRSRPLIDGASRAFGTVFSIWGRTSLGLMYTTDGRCNGCGKCARSCPSGAIAMKGKSPVWNLRCEGCMRCINGCPQAAIQTSIPRLGVVLALELASVVALIALFYVPYAQIFGDMAIAGMALALILWLLVFVVYVVPVTGAILQLLEYLPGFKSLCRLNFTRGYRRYLDPGFNTIERAWKD